MKSETDKLIEFTLLYNRHKKRLYNFILRLSKDQMVAEDIVQSVFIKLYEGLDELKNKGSANYWLFKSARNEYYNYYRKSKRMVELDESISTEKRNDMEFHENIELKEIKKLVLNELNKMSEDQKEVYLLKEYGRLSYKEISETMNITVDLVKSRLYKVRQKLLNKISKLI